MKMSEDKVITSNVIETVSDAAKQAASLMLRKVASEYGLDSNDIFLTYDNGNFVYKVNRGDKVEIVCGQDMRPTNPKEFGKQLRQVLSFISDKRMVSCKSLESVNTIKARNDKYQEQYRNMRKSKLLPQSQLVYRKFTSIMVVDEKSKQSIMVTGEDVNIWDLQNEAHILLSKKVLGD
jgi:hypothetical protein